MRNSSVSAQKECSYVIREAKPNDYSQLLPLMDQLGYPIEKEKMESNLKNYCQLSKQKAWVAEKDNKIIGCLAAAITDYFHLPKAFLRVISLVIDKDHRRMGIGKKLMQKAESYACDMGCMHVELTSGTHRAGLGTHDFYRSLGYTDLYDRKKYFAKKLSPFADLRSSICQLIEAIDPYDAMESQQIQSTLNWINSGAEIFRISKPDVPDVHLVSYFVPLDFRSRKILLTDHKKARLWLPPGGHVEVGEHPAETVKREAMEELGFEAIFISPLPFFLTISETTGKTGVHSDISLWYLISADCSMTINYDPEEFNQINWFTFDKIPYSQADPHMERFICKLKNRF